ncbi:MAG: MFS transporter [Actinomycetes bacterium]
MTRRSTGTQARSQWLSRNLVVLSLVSLTQDAASELMYPLMPLFLTGVLAAPAIVLGAVEGCAEVAAGVSKYLAGRASDRIGRRTFITTGYGLAGIGKAIVAASLVWPTVLIGRVIDRVGKGVRSAPRDAMITNSVAPEYYSRALGFHRSADTLGAVIGPIIALIGLQLLNGNVRAVMWWAVIPAIASVILTLLVKEVKKAPKPEPVVPQARVALPREFWTAATPLILIAMTNIPDTLILLRISQLGVSTTHVVLAYIAFNAVYTLAAFPAGIIAARLQPARVYAIGLVAFGLTYIALGQITHESPLLYLVVALYGFFPALTDGIGKAIIATQTAKAVHGRAQGIFQSLSGGAILVAGLWGGLLWNSGAGHGSVPLTIAGSLALLGAVYLVKNTMIASHSDMNDV